MDKLLKKKQKAIEEGNESALCAAHTDLAEHYMREENFYKAIDEYESLSKIYKKQKKIIEFATTFRGIGEAYLMLNEYEKAIEYQKIYLGLAREQNNTHELQRALAVLGHTYLTKYITDKDKENLNLAHKYTMRSLEVSQRLSDIKKYEMADLTARLYNNLGMIFEFQGHHGKSMEFFNKTIVLCKANDVFESLHQAYNSLASLLERKGEYNKAIQNFNLAIETGKKLKDKDSALCDCLISRGNILLKLGDMQAAKRSFYKAYKLKLSKKSKFEVEKKLKIVLKLCKLEKEMVSELYTGVQLQNFYEKMADGFSALGCNNKALSYYHKMLEQAEKTNNNLGPCFYSLAATYRDDEQFDKAIEFFEKEYLLCDFKKGLDTLCEIADTLEMSGSSSSEVIKVYERAINNCRTANNEREKGRMLGRLIDYLERTNNEDLISNYQKEFEETGFVPSDSEELSQHEDSGDDVSLDNITDYSEDSDCDSPNRKRRSKTFQLRRNLKGETQLHTACISGKLNVVKHLLDQGHPVNVRDNGGWLPLHEACNSGHIEVVKLLLDKGAAINDGGGTHCNGTTPLHDASINCHLEIVELLLDRGASVLAKTGDDETPYHYLRKAAIETQLDETRKQLCDRLLERMSTILDKAGHSKEINTSIKNTALIPGQDVNQYERGLRRRRVRETSEEDDLTFQQRRSSGSGRLSGGTSFENAERNQEKEVVAVPETHAAYEYKLVMDNLKKKPCDLPRTSSGESLKRSALLMNDEVVDDDWLDDDLGIMNSSKKRKKCHGHGILDTFNTKAPSISPTGQIDKRRDSMRSVSSKGSISKSSTTSKKMRRIKSNETITSSKSDEENILVDADSEDEFLEHSQNRRRMQQTSLLDAGFNRCMTPSDVYQSTSRPSHKRSIQGKITHFGSTSPTKSSHSQSNRSSSSPRKSFLIDDDPMLAMDVNIEGRPFRVTTKMSLKNDLTVKWLALEAARRYAKKEYVEPVLELKTKSGAELVDDDTIGTLFITDTQVVEVIANVLKWNLPPIRERYKEACADMCTNPLEVICHRLDGITISLDLKNNGFPPESMAPLCKALLRENKLLELDLSNNFLSLDCMKLLTSSIHTLENLTKLNLSCTNLHTEEIRCFSNMFSNSTHSILTKLYSLDLSENFICDENLQDIALITSYLSLRELNISLLNFTENVFEKSYNRNIKFSFSNIEELNLSGNYLGNSAVEKFLMFANPSRLTNLDVSNNKTTTGFLTSLVNCLNRNEFRLKFEYLNLSRCSVEDSEVFNLLRCCDNLAVLNLSYTNVTSLTLRRLLGSSTVREICLVGCLNINSYFEETNTWVLEDYFSKTKSLKITCDQDKFSVLKRLWKEKNCDIFIREVGNLLVLNSN